MKVALAALRPRRAVLLAWVGWLMVAPASAMAQDPGAAAPVSTEAPEGRLIDQVVAIIEGQVLTLSEL